MRQVTSITPASRGNGQGSREGAVLLWGLPPEALRHLSGALKTQFKRYRKRLKRCQKQFTEAAVHNSRIETRRLLALVELLAGFLSTGRVKKIQGTLRRHLDTFDELRDTQVQLPAVSKMRRAFPAARAFEAYLLRREKRLTRRTRRDIKQVKTRRLSHWLSACRREVAAVCDRRTPAAAGLLPVRCVERAYARTCRLRARIDPCDPTTIHHTRIAFKKFRYMVESLAGFLPATNGHYLDALHEYQTLMGSIQDAEVLLRSFERYLLKQKLELAVARRFHQELLRRREALLREFLNASGRLLGFWPPAKAALFTEP